MKRLLFMISIILWTTVLPGCAGNDENPIVAQGKTACFTIVDDLSKSPVDSANVQLHGRDTYGLYFMLYQTTDVQGKCCFGYASSSSLIDLFVYKKGYVPFCPVSGWLPETVRLTRAGYLQLHVKNVPPVDPSDLMGVTCPEASCFGWPTLDFEGANVDTTFTINAAPGTLSISYFSWHNNIRNDSTLSNILVESRDITFVEILY